MKHLAVLLFFFAATHAQADCQDSWLEHHSTNVDLSVIYSKGCYQGELMLNFSTPPINGLGMPSTNTSRESLPFVRECPSTKKNKEGEVIEFSCRKDGTSPLAGATYRFKQVKTSIECDGVKEPTMKYFFKCVRGCAATTPKSLDVQFGEGCS